MRLLQIGESGTFSLVERTGSNIPPYAILSHTWGADEEEVTFRDLVDGTGVTKVGYRKIRFCGNQAARDGLRFFWVDTCCIDKASSAELAESINSMFRWYRDSAKCYVYLSDVSESGLTEENESSRRWKPAFRKSRWFTRGWTLQELIAPTSVEFFSKEEKRLGDKQSMEQTLHERTGIPFQAILTRSLSDFSVNERMSWAKDRQTKREEDEAYCLLGLFDIHMPLIYGEGRKKAMDRLQRHIKEEESTKDGPASLGEEQRRILLESLKFEQLDARQMTIRNAHAKTCKWLLNSPAYLSWLDDTKTSEHNGFLWIKGKPGTGKSTLMKFALTNTRRTMKDSIIISFFFNARGERLEKSTIGTYQSLLLQLLDKLPALQCVFDSLCLSVSSISTCHQWSVESLKMMLEQVIKGLGNTSVVCFIDALDECEERQIRDMISFFERISQLAVEADVQFKVCFSSRHYPHITIEKNVELVLEGQEGHDQDIVNYVNGELKIGHSRAAEQVRTELQDKASGVFMWVILVVEILNKEHDSGRMHALRKRLREIPGDLHELFRDILTRDFHNRDELVLCIQWVLFSKQPLNPEQLYFAIRSGVEPENPSIWDPEEITRDDIERFILNSSKGLTEITTSKIRKVQFIHESVKDFLVKENGLGNIWPDLGSNLQGQSHERLKHCCLNYINTDIVTLLEIPGSLPKASLREALHLRQSATSAFPFLEYAVYNALYHADMAASCGIAQKHVIESFPLFSWIKLANLFEKHQVRRYTKDVTLLYVLAEGNMSNLIRIHPSISSWFEVGKERYGPPLFAALATGSEEVVRTILQALAMHQSPGSRLHKLCSQYSLNEGRRGKLGRDFKFSTRTLLSNLVELGDEAIFALVLETGKVDVDSMDFYGRTPLWLAAKIGNEAVMKLLVETGKVYVDSKGDNERTPLWLAAEIGNEAIIKLLLETDKVDVNFKDISGASPLWMAARNGHDGVVKLLLEKGNVDVDSEDSNGRTPLWLAAEIGNEAVFKLLLETGKVDVNVKDLSGYTPLLRAARNGHHGVVELLLKMGKVNINSFDISGLTPLLIAAEKGHEAVVKLLLETGMVDVNVKDLNNETPLWMAARNGHDGVVKLLLKMGKVNINVKDLNNETPLWMAARNGHDGVVKLLLKMGKVNINSSDVLGLTPLWMAAEKGHEAVVKLLLETGKANVDIRDPWGTTALSVAVRNGHEGIVKLLQSHISLS
jgi:ankyrin repeat protein